MVDVSGYVDVLRGIFKQRFQGIVSLNAGGTDVEAVTGFGAGDVIASQDAVDGSGLVLADSGLPVQIETAFSLDMTTNLASAEDQIERHAQVG